MSDDLWTEEKAKEVMLAFDYAPVTDSECNANELLIREAIQSAYHRGLKDAEDLVNRLNEIWGPTYAQRTERLVKAAKEARAWFASNYEGKSELQILPVREQIYMLDKALAEFEEKK